MELLYWLESIRNPVCDAIVAALTYLGDEIAFMAVALILFWCVDKRQGYYILSVGFLGTIANQFMKLWFRIPRPWVQDPNFKPVEAAIEGASGYSFPSGHTQTSVGTFGGIALVSKNKDIRWICVAIAVIVPFSRMYLGVHTPLDVGVAALMAIALIFIMRPLIFGKDGKYIPYVLGGMSAIALAYLLFVQLYPFPADVDAHNLESGTKNAFTMIGALSAFIIVYITDEKWLHFEVKAVWWAQLVKVIVGLILVIAVKEGLRAPLEMIMPSLLARSVRYFALVIVAGIVWPLSFKWFAKLGKKE